MYLATEVASSDYDKAHLFNKFIHNLYKKSVLNFAPQLSLSDTLFTIDFSKLEVYDALCKLKSNKAMWIGSIGPLVLKTCAALLTKSLHHLFTLSIKYSIMPKK